MANILTSRTTTVAFSQAAILSVVGAITIAALTQVRIPLWFTPVPITGQTFAVLLWPLLFGRKAGLGAVSIYLAAGMLGAPVFSGFTALSALWGPTSGYLLGFLAAAAIMPTTDAPIGRILLSIVGGTAIILASGGAVLGLFVGYENVWRMGIEPFVVGDVVKTIALLASTGIARWTAQN